MSENDITKDILDASYLVVMGLQVGVLVNFGMNQLKDGYARVVNGYTGPKPSQQ